MAIEFLKGVLSDDLYTQVEAELNGNEKIRLANVADGSFVPKGKLDEERSTVKDLKAQIAELNGKIAQLQTGQADADSIRQQLSKLQADMAEKEAAMQRQALEYRVKDSIRGANARNADVVLKMLDMAKISADGDNIIGLTDQLEALKKSDSYLFEPEKGASGGVDPHNEPTKPNGSNYDVNQAIRSIAGY